MARSTDFTADGFPGQRLVVLPEELLRAARRQPVLRDLRVTHIGAFRADHRHFVERERGARQHVMIACLAGRGSGRTGEGDWSVGRGELVFLPAGWAHSYRADPEQSWTIFWVHFEGERADDYLAMLGIDERQPVLGVDRMEVLSAAFEDCFRHTHSGFGEESMLGLSTAFARLLGLARVHRRATSGSGSRDANTRMHAALSRLRAEIDHDWSLRELAELAGMSVPHFTELCRRSTGLPPMALLIRLRLQRAMELLQQGTHNVGEAARAVGYADPFYFSRLFRRHMDQSPSDCRSGP